MNNSWSSEFSEEGVVKEIIRDIEQDYEHLCIGKGKADDITVVSMWISHRQHNHIL
jgi:hypothetical protein